MIDQPTPSGHSDFEDFAKQAELDRPSFLKELWISFRHNKRWWLTPIVVILLLVGLIIVLGSTAAAPLIYTLF